MSDRERVIEMLDDFGVVWREEDGRVVVEAQTGPKNVGYVGFVTAISFDEDGNFQSWGCWE